MEWEELIQIGLALQSKWKLPGFLAQHPKTADLLFNKVFKFVPSLLTTRYWSAAPYMLGNRAIKFNVTPCEDYTIKTRNGWSYNHLRDDLVKQLKEHEICYIFSVQFQRDPVKQPIEDHMIEWNEVDSPSIAVAKIIIPKQEFSSPENDKECEALSFNPWHSLEEHKPLGNMNRARLKIYEKSFINRAK